MKKNIQLLVLLILLLGFAKTASAQVSSKNVIKANLLSPIIGSYNFFYERVTSKKLSVQLGVGFTNTQIQASSIGTTTSTTTLTGFRINPELRFYPSDHNQAPKGFYIAPYISYQNLTLTLTNNISGINAEGRASLNTFGGGLILGRQWLIAKVVALDLFMGYGRNAGTLRLDASASANGFTASDFSTSSFNGVGVRFGLSLGVAF